MRYIDTFDHKLVGFFAGLPLYRLVEVVASAGGGEFGCTPLQLVLGGGSGEHPAVVLTHPSAAVVSFLQAALPTDGPALAEKSQRLMDKIPRVAECLQFADWGIADYVLVHDRCRSPSRYLTLRMG